MVLEFHLTNWRLDLWRAAHSVPSECKQDGAVSGVGSCRVWLKRHYSSARIVEFFLPFEECCQINHPMVLANQPPEGNVKNGLD
jgi:hypothetical protein